MTLKVVVFASFKKGKEDRLRELIKWVSSEIKATEPDVSHYEVFVADGDKEGSKEGVVYLHITNEEALVRRRQLKHHMEFAAIVEKESLLETPIRYLKLTDEVDGWHR
ncbi:hypothetical protein B0A48_18885 [Cryoendolithus antarcticus]|uniref:ABM domain-containing protein n=1 Tax=Cryoendolithus antarcticus TaxID=1507870 RepID=A0A1V8S7R0_9PEZI|nr:hypothetical protein B0A48_18885 [Cryoendolithus antarcticus]OQO16511.1 hypothetical protein B0A51_18196 [Rachicladosporium sp. CCFEE 5018]